MRLPCSLQVWHIMQDAKYGEDEDQIGVLRLAQNNSFNGYYPLHEVCTMHANTTIYCTRQLRGMTCVSCPAECYQGNGGGRSADRPAAAAQAVVLLDQLVQATATGTRQVHTILILRVHSICLLCACLCVLCYFALLFVCPTCFFLLPSFCISLTCTCFNER